MGLFSTPVWKIQDEAAALAAVEKLTSQSAIAKVVEKEERRFVREAATARLTDQKQVGRLIKKYGREKQFTPPGAVPTTVDMQRAQTYYSKQRIILEAAFSRLTDRALLNEYVFGSGSNRLSGIATDCLTDQWALTRLVFDGRRNLTDRLTDAQTVDETIDELLRGGSSKPNASVVMALLRRFTGRLPRSEKRLRALLAAEHSDAPAQHTDKTNHDDHWSGRGPKWNGYGSSDCHTDSGGSHEDDPGKHADTHPYRYPLSTLPPYEG